MFRTFRDDMSTIAGKVSASADFDHLLEQIQRCFPCSCHLIPAYLPFAWNIVTKVVVKEKDLRTEVMIAVHTVFQPSGPHFNRIATFAQERVEGAQSGESRFFDQMEAASRIETLITRLGKRLVEGTVYYLQFITVGLHLHPLQ